MNILLGLGYIALGMFLIMLGTKGLHFLFMRKYGHGFVRPSLVYTKDNKGKVKLR